MGSLFKRGKIYWAQLHRSGRRKRISLKTDNLGVARAKLAKLEYEQQTAGLQLPTSTPVGEIVQKFAEELKARSPAKSAQSDLYRLAEFLGPVCEALQTKSFAKRGNHAVAAAGSGEKGRRGKRPRKAKTYDCKVRVQFLEEVTPGMVADFLVKLRQRRRLNSKTLNQYREITQRLFNWAIKLQGIRMPGEPRHNPVTDVPRFRTTEKPIRFLSIEQIHEQLGILDAHPQIQAMVAVYCYAGLRRAEALWLTDADVDLDERLIHVRAKTVEGRFWQPKTRRNRVVPISAALMGYLTKWVGVRCARGPWFFPAPQGDWWDGDNFSHDLADINRRAGLPWGCLDYRHTFGSHLAMKGESLYKVSTLMGNSPEIARRHYAALTPESLEACVDFDDAPVAAAEPTLRLVS